MWIIDNTIVFNQVIAHLSYFNYNTDISKTSSTPDPRLKFIFSSLFTKLGKQYQVNVGSPSATTLAEHLMYILRRGTIRNRIMLALD